ncbi:MAG TPA: hypothetical protein ENF80_02895 [Thermofilum sp.]|nr:hypothetical protein [Thermofilum sp.]
MRIRILTLVILFSALLLTTISFAEPLVVAVARGLTEENIQLKTLVEKETFVNWKVITGPISFEEIKDATVVIFVKADALLKLSEEEIDALVKWFNEGGKTLWVAGDSDYGDEGPPRQATINRILEAVGSKLRIESGAVEDPTSNAGKPYRVLGLPACAHSRVRFLVAKIDRALFHGPAAVIAYVNGEYVRLEESEIEGIYPVMCTSEDGIIVNHNPPDPEAHGVGEFGSFVLMAIEFMKDKNNFVIVTGDAPYDHYLGMYKPELKVKERYTEEYPQQGELLVRRLISLATKPELFKVLLGG